MIHAYAAAGPYSEIEGKDRWDEFLEKTINARMLAFLIMLLLSSSQAAVLENKACDIQTVLTDDMNIPLMDDRKASLLDDSLCDSDKYYRVSDSGVPLISNNGYYRTSD